MWQDVKNVYHLFMALLANLWFGFPSRKLTVIGVSGTDGKTTTVHLIHYMLTKAGYDASMISSIGAVINGKAYDTGFHVTTPSPWQLQRFLKMVAYTNAGQKPPIASENRSYMVLEVTSHALDQNRVWGIDFAVGVLTNVTPEHLDYHKTYEEYVQTKTKLLFRAKVAVVNRDDNSFGVISNFKFPISNKIITYGIQNKADITQKTFPFKTKLIGKFNTYNVLASVAVCKALGMNDGVIREAIATFTLPKGRAEVVHENNFTVIIDFAHTPNAIEQLLCSIKPKGGGRLIHVFGSAGERDQQKRPRMGAASAKYSDVIVLTAEDSRSESTERIMDEIVSGVENGKCSPREAGKMLASRSGENGKLLKVPNRQEAINMAVNMAKKGDVVVLTGKGHEQSMNFGKGEEPWSEHEAVQKALARGPAAGFPPRLRQDYGGQAASASAAVPREAVRSGVGSPSTRVTPRSSYEKN